MSAEPERWSPAGKLGLGFGLGLVVVCHSLFAASLLGFTPAWWIVIVAALLLWGAAGAVRGGRIVQGWSLARGDAARNRSPSRSRLEAGLLLLIVVICGLGGFVAIAEPLVEWDVLSVWAYKARILLLEPLSRTDYLSDATRAYSHLDYPLLWPLAMSWIWMGAGGPDLVSIKLLAPALLAGFAMTFYALLARAGDRSSALLFTSLLVVMPMFLSQTVRLQADVALAYFATGAGAATYLWLRDLSVDGVRVAGLFACGLLFTKNEGAALYAVLVLATGVALARPCPDNGRRRRSAAAWLLALPALVTGGWFLLRTGIPKLHEDYPSRLDPAILYANADRLPEILVASLAYLAEPRDWLFFWPALALFLIATSRIWAQRPSLLFLLTLAELPLLLYLAVFVVSPWDPRRLLEASASRVLLHTFPLQLLLVAEIVRTAALLPWLTPAKTSRE